MKVAGIDFSTLAVDLVLLDEDTPAATWHRFPLAGATALEKARSLRARFPGRSWFEDQGVYLVGIEDPIGRFPATQKALGCVAGATAALLPPDVPLRAMTPSQWFPASVGCAPPRLSDERKELATNWALHVVELEAADKWPHDAFDAYAIAWAARALHEKAIDQQRGAA